MGSVWSLFCPPTSQVHSEGNRLYDASLKAKVNSALQGKAESDDDEEPAKKKKKTTKKSKKSNKSASSSASESDSDSSDEKSGESE